MPEAFGPGMEKLISASATLMYDWHMQRYLRESRMFYNQVYSSKKVILGS